MKIGDVARAAGCSVRALRHYHEAGALPEPARTTSGYRDYSIDDLAAVFRIRALVEAGVALRDIAELGPDALERAHQDLTRKIERLHEQQRKLEALMSADHGVPHEITSALRGLARQFPDIAEHLDRELGLLQMMALCGVATYQTWELISANLASEHIRQATVEGFQLWTELGETSEPTPELIERFRTLLASSYLRGIEATMVPGDLPLSFADVPTTGAQAAALKVVYDR